jgi:hypothetical protein
MSTTVIPPGNTNFVVDTNSEDHKRGYGHGYNLEDQIYRPTERLKDSLAEALASISNQNAATQVAVEKNGSAGQLATEKNGSAGQLATEKTAAATMLANSLAFANTQNLMVSGFKDGRWDSANATASIINGQTVGFKDARYDAAVNFAALQKDVLVSQNSIEAKIAACCCELKARISAEGDETRALVNSIDARRGDRDLVDAKNEVTLLKLQLASHASVNPVVP